MMRLFKSLNVLFLGIVLLCNCPTQFANAQNVNIGPQTGRLIAGLGVENEFGFVHGWKSLWWHNQLPMKMIASDDTNLDIDGILIHHACNLKFNDGQLVIISTGNCYLNVTLPHGYRITGYNLTVANDLDRNNSEYQLGSYQIDQSNTEWKLYETNSDFDTSTPYASVSLGTARNIGDTQYTLSRTSLSHDDMSNNLYLVFQGTPQNSSTTISGVSVKKFTVFYEADPTFEVSIKPTTDNAQGVSYVGLPFDSGKLGLGDIRWRQKTADNTTASHFAYEYREVEDVIADMVLYEQGAVNRGYVEEVGDKTITQHEQPDGSHYFGLKNKTYFIESPTLAFTSHGNADPIGYRITGGKINYQFGTYEPARTITVTEHDGEYTIQSTLNINNDASQGQSVYYLHPSGRFVRQQEGETQTKYWKISGNPRNGGIIHHEQNGEYTYLVYYYTGSGFGRRYYITTRTATSLPTGDSETVDGTRYYNKFTINNNNRIVFTALTTSHYITAAWDSELGAYKVNQTSTANGSSTITSSTVTRTVNQPEFNPTPYTLTVYDKDGTSILETVEVNSSNPSGSISFDNFNNDAVKFSISDLPADDANNVYRALITADIKMQSLDPYIKKLNITCTDNTGQKTITQQFVAEDFTVRGEPFRFYVPKDWDDSGDTTIPEDQRSMPCTFSFEELHNNDEDETYYNGANNGRARNSLVGSEYYPADPTSTAALISSYVNVYNADNETDYTKKVSTVYSGTQPFYFTNADELDHDIATQEIRTLHQYQFSYDAYTSQHQVERLDANNQTIYTGEPAGTFHKLVMNNRESQKAYLFVCDEPRYNIAPTYATEHRMYAYYDMEIQLLAEDYDAVLEWTKVYDSTCYYDGGSAPATKSQWGLKIKTSSTEADGGYLPMSKIVEALEARQADDTHSPKDLDQALYVDASEMSTIVYSKNTGSANNALEQMRKMFGPNVIVYLPLNMESDYINFATLTPGGEYHSCNNVTLYDRKPFYIPYDVRVDSRHTVTYAREASGTNKTVKMGTLILPFELKIDETGTHTNIDGSCKFQLHQMQASNCLSVTDSDLNGNEPKPKNYYSALEAAKTKIVSTSTANTPYMFSVPDDGVPSNKNYSFIATQHGATLKATSAMRSDYVFLGETGTGKVNNSQYIFQNTGSFSGKQLAKASNQLFYFSNNALVNLANLKTDYGYSLPFRSWYSYTQRGGSTPMYAKSLEIVFGENDDPTGIDDITTASGTSVDLVVAPGEGQVTMLSTIDRNVTLYTTSGTTAAHTQLKADVPTTVNLPAGIYIVNNVKVIVK